MRLYTAVLVALGLISIGQPTAFGAIQSANQAPDSAAINNNTAPENDLRQQLLNELMSDKPLGASNRANNSEVSGERGGASKASHALATASTASTSGDQVGSAVASVPTWPIMVLMLVLGGVLIWFKRGNQGRNSPFAINKLATVPLGGKRSLALVDVLGQKLVLGLSEKGLVLLARIDGSKVTPVSESHSLENDPLEDDLAGLVKSREEEEFFMPSTMNIAGTGEQQELARKFKNLRST